MGCLPWTLCVFLILQFKERSIKPTKQHLEVLFGRVPFRSSTSPTCHMWKLRHKFWSNKQSLAFVPCLQHTAGSAILMILKRGCGFNSFCRKILSLQDGPRRSRSMELWGPYEWEFSTPVKPIYVYVGLKGSLITPFVPIVTVNGEQRVCLPPTKRIKGAILETP